MKRFWLGIAAAVALSACSGGNPFAEGTTDLPTVEVPDKLAGDLTSITYDPVAQTLTVTGISLDDTPITAVYRRRPGLDSGGYEAYTAQDSSLDRHSTAYIRQLDGATASIVVTGGQFSHYFGGSTYGRIGAFDPPDVTPTSGIVSYAGNYIGLVNGPGDGGDLHPVTPGTDPDILPVDAAEVTGQVLINADFADNVVNGIVYNRRLVDYNRDLAVLDLNPTGIEADGTFAGKSSQALQDKGDYAGVFAGVDSSAVAGTLFVEDHIDGIDNEEEYGLFVLAQCGTPTADPVCNQPVP